MALTDPADTGTSYAAPIVTGLIARLIDRDATPVDALYSELKGLSVDLGDAGRDDGFGWGLVKSNGC